MHHNLIRILRCIDCVALTPIITDGIRKDIPIFVEIRCRDSASDCGITLESVFRDAVPEVECPVGAGRAESSVLWVEGDSIYGIDIGHVVLGRVAVTFEGKI